METTINSSPSIRCSALVVGLILASASGAFGEEDDRIREPILLEGRNFRLFFDRHDPTFRLEDRQTNLSWHTALDRRGFASILLPNPDGGDPIERPIDRMEGLRVHSNAISFRAASSHGKIPPVDIEVAVGSPIESIRLSFKTDDPFLDKGGAVKILDRLWIRSADTGGALIPVGLGEWMDVSGKPLVDRRFGWQSEPEAARPLLLRGMGLLRGRSTMLVTWDDDGVEGRAVRRDVGSESTPIGMFDRQIETSLTLRGSARSIQLIVTGPGEFRDVLNNYREVLRAEGSFLTVRSKSRRTAGPPPFVGAALFRVPLGSQDVSDFEAVSRLSESFFSRLGIDRAVWIVENWLVPPRGEAGWSFRVDHERGGEKGLVVCANMLRERGHGLGLEFPVTSSCEDSGLDVIQEGVDQLQSILGQPLVIFDDNRSVEGRASRGSVSCMDQIARGFEGRFHLMGSTTAGAALFRRFVYLEGSVDRQQFPLTSKEFFPLVPAVVGRRARLGVSAEDALRAGQPDAVLDFLLLGEVPLFALSGAGDSDGEAGVFTRTDGGWFASRDFSPHERFIKTTYEVLTAVARLRARNELHSFERLDDSGAVQRVHYGFDLRITINRGEQPYEDPDGKFVLPRYGFWIQHPFFFAFHATMANGVTYKKPALFTIRPLENKLWLRASKVRVWHAFGDSEVRLGGKRFDIPDGELFTKIW